MRDSGKFCKFCQRRGHWKTDSFSLQSCGKEEVCTGASC